MLLAGCALGPDYQGPPGTPGAGPPGQPFVRAAGDLGTQAPAPAPWWIALNDPVLDTLIAQTLQASPDLGVARARLRQGRAALGLEQANRLPTVSASALYAHARLPPTGLAQGAAGGNGADGNGGDGTAAAGASQLNLYSFGLDASWELDLFGGQQRAIEAARATLDASQASLADVQVSLAANTAEAYFNLRERQHRAVLLDRSLATQQEILALSRQRVAQGTASEADLIRLDNQLQQTQGDLLPLRAQIEACLNQLATLSGKAPGALDQALAGAGQALPLPPAVVEVGDAGQLLRRRPDIRVAERRLAADTARIGQAEASRYPSIKFLGLLGIGGTRPADLTRLDDYSLVAAPMLSWNFLDFGRGKARVVQADAVRDESEASYRKVVLEALRDAEDALGRFRHTREQVAVLARTRVSADRALVLTRQRYQAGTASLIDVLDGTRQALVAEQALSQGQASLLLAYVGVQKSLGLGWDAGQGHER